MINEYEMFEIENSDFRGETERAQPTYSFTQLTANFIAAWIDVKDK